MVEYKYLRYSKMNTGELRTRAQDSGDGTIGALRMQLDAKYELGERERMRRNPQPSTETGDDGMVDGFTPTELSGIFKDGAGRLWSKKGKRMTMLGDDAIGLYKK